MHRIEERAPAVRVRRRASYQVVRMRDERGASAVEFAIIAPLLVLLVFGIIQFGIAFLQMQTLRGAVREGGRAAAVCNSDTNPDPYCLTTVQSRTQAASLGGITDSTKVTVSRICNSTNIGQETIVTFPVTALPGGGIQVRIPLMPTITLRPAISSSFRCEV
jgi:Flp pilus assembly protein TadG